MVRTAVFPLPFRSATDVVEKCGGESCTLVQGLGIRSQSVSEPVPLPLCPQPSGGIGRLAGARAAYFPSPIWKTGAG